MLSYLMGMVRLAWSAQNNNYAVSLQYLKKSLSYEVVLHADKRESLLRVNIINFDGVGQGMQKALRQVYNIFVAS